MTDTGVSSAFVQAVWQGAGSGAIAVTNATVQTVTAVLAPRLSASFLSLQVVHKGDDGAMTSMTNATTQVVWTTGAGDSTRQRAWTFDLDGHVFYALDLGPSGTLVYDLATGQWARFETEGFGGNWNFKNGFHWRDGNMVVGGYAGEGTLLKLTPDAFLDEGWRPVVYETSGVIQHDDISHIRQYSLRLVGSAGVLADGIAPVLNMRFSDDRGETWSDEYSVALTTDTQQRIEFRSLGAFTAPGRVFKIYDTGGVKYIGFIEAELGGANG